MTASDSDQPRVVAVVFNPVKTHVKALKASVTDAADSLGWEPRWYETSVEDEGQGVTRQALDAGASLVLVSGGDGTVRAVAEAMRSSGVPLALIPAGTGNLLARNLRLPLGDLRDAVTIAFGENERAIDVGVAEITAPNADPAKHVFMVMAGLGLDAAIIANTRSVLKKAVGWLAYVDAGVRSLSKVSKLHIRYSIEPDPERTAHISTILIGNCGSLPGNIELLPDARIDDGQLDVAILQPKSIFGWLMIWRKVTLENRVLRRSALGRSYIKFTGSEKTRIMTYLRGADIRLTLDKPEPFELDGDGFGEVVSAHLWVDAGALTVKVAAPRNRSHIASRE